MIVHARAYTKQQIHSDIPNKKKGIHRTKHCSATDTNGWDMQLVQNQHLGHGFIFPSAGSRTQPRVAGLGVFCTSSSAACSLPAFP